MPYSQKLVTAVFTNILTLVVAYLVTKLGLHESALVATQVAAGVAILAGAAAGWAIKEVPQAYLQPGVSVAKDVATDLKIAQVHADSAVMCAKIKAGASLDPAPEPSSTPVGFARSQAAE